MGNEQFERLAEKIAQFLEARLGQWLSKIEQAITTLGTQGVSKDWYSTKEIAKIVDRDVWTVRDWCRIGRIRAEKQDCGHGKSLDWRIRRDELVRYQNHGLRPVRANLTSLSED